MKPKKVAIIGAGPSGLVTAKTLLHNFPPGTFSPVVFDARHEVGGLWPVREGSGTGSEGTLDPSMPTNLSRFTVGFSDLSWESVLGPSVPVFPQAGQVGLYLDAYRKRYIPDNVMRLGHRVVKTVRTARSEWEVSWKERHGPGSDDQIQVERFDFLVVASGYFARPCIPSIPGLELKELEGRVFHSSELRKTNGRLRDEKNLLADGNVVVIGGSMSGAEAASAVALHQSSHNEDKSLDGRQKVYHVHSRPFWTLPTYLPHEISEDKVSFLPLDLAMYDLSRRPPGPIDYQLGLIPEEKVAKTNSYFGSILGDEYAGFGYAHGSGTNGIASQPPWVAIGNDYEEFIRSGAIEATMGRVTSVQSESTGLACIKIDYDDGQSQTLENIAAVVMATGYTPFEALSFLSQDILSTLEYSTDDPFLPLVLDKGGTIRSEVPDLGFVGFYRGPYWGAMEMQARFLGTEWAKDGPGFSADDQRTSVRILRQPDSISRRSQFPMGDYVGLMESFAGDLGIDRTALSNAESRSGPVIPARYVFGQESSHESAMQETQSTVSALMETFENQRGQDMATSMAIFRALHGKWKFVRTNKVGDQESGIVEFSPHYPSNGAGREYVCHEYLETRSAEGISLNPANRSIFRLFDADGTAEIQISPGSLEIQQSHQPSTGVDHMLEVTGLTCKTLDGKNQPGEYVAHARARSLNGTLSSNGRGIVEDSNSEAQGRYVFHFKGVSVVTWESFSSGDSVLGANEGPGTVDGPYTRTLYERCMA